MQDYNIEVGDRVTYIDYSRAIIVDRTDLEVINSNEILKIERIGQNGWYTVYEKEKELLTEEERKFLKDIIKYYDITHILCCENSMDLHNENLVVACLDYPKNLKFKNIHGKRYSISELGLYEGE